MMSDVYLGLGSNIGDKQAYLKAAVEQLSKNKAIIVKKKSSLYQTKPVGEVVQDDFLNAVILVETSLTPATLLEEVHKVENDLHRKRVIHWGPRTIDIDILFYDDLQLNKPDLVVPHPEIANRSFVLTPLMEIATDKLKTDFPIESWWQDRDDKDDVIKAANFD